MQFKTTEVERALEQRIADVENEIKKQEATVASLAAEGHEVTDATRHLHELTVCLAGLLQSQESSKSAA
jgi:uncharacterized coiled-coil protein SlyX